MNVRTEKQPNAILLTYNTISGVEYKMNPRHRRQVKTENNTIFSGHPIALLENF